MDEPRMGTMRPTMKTNVLLTKSSLGKVGATQRQSAYISELSIHTLCLGS